MELLLFQIVLAASPVLFLLSKRYLFRTVLFFVLFAGGISTFWALRTLGGNPLEGTLLLPLMGTFPRVVMDPLSAFFVLVINFTVLSGTLYARGYLQSCYDTKSAPELRLHYFSFLVLHFSMLLVCMLREALPFLLAWELMSLSSFFLVIFEGRKKEVLKIGISYLIQMHLGFLCIMSAFLIAWTRTGVSPSFEGLGAYFASFPEFPLFLLFFVGFGIKAGFIPLHSWLPHAHPAAPSHVSGIMSGVMIKMGIYGILRVLLYMHKDLLETGTFLLGISMVSGLLGVMYAMVQHDMKKLLAYHSIEKHRHHRHGHRRRASGNRHEENEDLRLSRFHGRASARAEPFSVQIPPLLHLGIRLSANPHPESGTPRRASEKNALHGNALSFRSRRHLRPSSPETAFVSEFLHLLRILSGPFGEDPFPWT